MLPTLGLVGALLGAAPLGAAPLGAAPGDPVEPPSVGPAPAQAPPPKRTSSRPADPAKGVTRETAPDAGAARPTTRPVPREAMPPARGLALPARVRAPMAAGGRSAPPTDVVGPRVSWGRWTLWEGLTGFGVAALTVPATLALGHEIGKHGPSYLAAALPGLLLLLALPPAAVATAEYFLGQRIRPGQMRFHPAFWTAMGVQLVTMVIAIAAGTTTHELGGASAFAVADALLLPGTVTLMLYLTRRKDPPAPAPFLPSSPIPSRTGAAAALHALGEERARAQQHRLAPSPAGGVVFDVWRARF